MNRTRLSVSILAAAVMIGPGLLVYGADAPAQSEQQPQSQQDTKQPDTKQQDTKTSDSQSDNKMSDRAPDGFVILDERIITLTANEPQDHFLRAQEFLDKNDARSAAAEVRIGASYLDMQASRDKGDKEKDAQQSLTSEADQLRSIADQLQKEDKQDKQDKSQGDTKEQKQLTGAFATANHALAESFQTLAQKEIAQKKGIMAGNDLDAAASSLTAAYTWSGQTPSQAATTAVNDAHRVAQELLSPDMPMDNAADQSASSSDKGDKSTDAAQPAAARMPANTDETAANGKIPDDASKVIDALGKTIQDAANMSDHDANGTKASGQSENADKSKS